jgi:hypothetical protein
MLPCTRHKPNGNARWSREATSSYDTAIACCVARLVPVQALGSLHGSPLPR